MCNDAGLWLSDAVIGSALLLTVAASILRLWWDFPALGSCPPECAAEWSPVAVLVVSFPGSLRASCLQPRATGVQVVEVLHL